MKKEKFAEECTKLNVFVKCRSNCKNIIDEVMRICNKTEYFGNSPLTFYFTDLQKYFMPNIPLKIRIGEKLLEELLSAAGEHNVAISSPKK